jgi:hypothetical protein
VLEVPPSDEQVASDDKLCRRCCLYIGFAPSAQSSECSYQLHEIRKSGGMEEPPSFDCSQNLCAY